MQNIPATLAALAIFNGLGLSPVNVSPLPRLRVAGPTVAPRFTQAERYLSRFFQPGAAALEYAPLEVFNEGMAAATWIRATLGTLDYSFKAEGVPLPLPHDVDPALWFRDLTGMVQVYVDAACPENIPALVLQEMAARVQAGWWPEAATAKGQHPRRAYLDTLYAQARRMQERDQFITSTPAILRARVKQPRAPGQQFPFPE